MGGRREREKGSAGLKVKSARERDEAERGREETRGKERKPLRENQPGGHSSRVCTTSLCDFYTRSDFLAAPLALARQIYVPWPYKSRAYKDIEAKPTRISHPIPRARFSSPPRAGSPPRFSLPHHPVCHHTWYTLLFYQPLPFTSSFFASFYPGPRDAVQEDEESKGLAHNRFTVLLSSSHFPIPYATNRRPNNTLTCSIWTTG